jgi:hypothetical protein
VRGFGNCRVRGRRAVPRVNASMRAVLVLGAEQRFTELKDISRTGVCVTGSNLPGTGEDVGFKVGEVQAFGEVIRSHDGECVVAFDVPIAGAQVGRVRTLANFVAGLRWPEWPIGDVR